jgi:hypothetical protein
MPLNDSEKPKEFASGMSAPIQLMKTVLDDATAGLPEAKRTSAIKAEMACSILTAARKGETNPNVLRALAVAGLVDCTHFSHDISPERRVV